MFSMSFGSSRGVPNPRSTALSEVDKSRAVISPKVDDIESSHKAERVPESIEPSIWLTLSAITTYGIAKCHTGINICNMLFEALLEADQRIPSCHIIPIKLILYPLKALKFCVDFSSYLALGLGCATIISYTASCVADYLLKDVEKSLAQLQEKDKALLNDVNNLTDIPNLISTKAQLESLKYYVDKAYDVSLIGSKFFGILSLIQKAEQKGKKLKEQLRQEKLKAKEVEINDLREQIRQKTIEREDLTEQLKQKEMQTKEAAREARRKELEQEAIERGDRRKQAWEEELRAKKEAEIKAQFDQQSKVSGKLSLDQSIHVQDEQSNQPGSKPALVQTASAALAQHNNGLDHPQDPLSSTPPPNKISHLVSNYLIASVEEGKGEVPDTSSLGSHQDITKSDTEQIG